MLTFWTNLAALGDICMLSTSDATLAARFFHVRWMGIVFVEPALLDLVLSVSVWAARWDHPIRQFGIYIPSFTLLILDAMDGILNGIQLKPWGFEAIYGPLFMLWLAFWILYIGCGVFVLLMDLKDKKSGQRPIYMTLLIGILIPTLINSISAGTNKILGIPDLISSNLSLILFLVFFELAIYRRRIFVLMPKKEHIKEDYEKSKLSLPPGSIYRIEGEPPAVIYGFFRRLVLSDMFGLAISRRTPQSIKEETCLIETPMVWLSSTPKDGIRTVSPSEIGQIVYIVKEFIKKVEGTVILLDGLEFLIFQNGPKITLSALFLLSETISTSNARVLIPIDPKAIDPATLALIQRETVDLRTIKGFERKPTDES
jgi:hypothetical protein